MFLFHHHTRVRIPVRSLVTRRNGELSNKNLRNSIRPGSVYLKTKHKAAKEFLEKEQYRVAVAIIEELDEKDFVDFVKLRCINLEYDSCIVKRLQEKNWNIALAYMLEEGNGKTQDALVI